MPHVRAAVLIPVILLLWGAALPAAAPKAEPPKGPPMLTGLSFQKIKVSDEAYESAAAFDITSDGKPDIACGAWWYEGPDFQKKHKIGDLKVVGGDYYDDFSNLPMDVNGDGYTDFVTGGWFCGAVQWRENPRGDPAKEWPLHEIAKTGNVETSRAWDVDGDGKPEIVPNTPGGPQRIYKPILDAAGKGTGRFSEHVIYDAKTGHGFGCGDVNGDGRPDIVLAKGWLQAPAQPLGGEKWAFHQDFNLGGGTSCPLIVADVNGDGKADLIVGNGHGYGLDWHEQKSDGGKRTFVKHPIDPGSSQYHDMIWTDIDGDGKPELVTGKRLHAHRGKDPGDADPAGIYYFKWNGQGFDKYVIDYGPQPAGKGCGICFQVVDVDGDGRPDVVAPGKDGLVLYKNLGFVKPPPK